MTVAIKQIHPVFVGEVSGVDLTKPLTREEAAAIEEGMNRYGVLVFRGQNITDEQQIAFTRNFGELEVKSRPGNIRKASESRLGAGIGDLSNLDKDGKIISGDDRQWFFKLGDRLWHSDSSYAVIPAKFSALSARAIPSWGGNTDFADMRAAYDALDERTEAEVEDLICEHSLIHSRAAVGFTDLTPEEIASFKPVLQRLVRTHQATGRKSLFLSAHAGAIVGWTVPEARAYLRELTEHATQREFVYSHQWRQYDLVMWDNRATMHRAKRFDRNEVRDMRRTTLGGDRPTVEQQSEAA
ncbi:TauD/TfdA dioxygenase family protein [Reyranella sp.]|uniref:TauD/TfdA dioxygenase family protein n=1 Tax=Reyranella sp. TaxID=1929291 RepID=UPI003F72EAF7